MPYDGHVIERGEAQKAGLSQVIVFPTLFLLFLSAMNCLSLLLRTSMTIGFIKQLESHNPALYLNLSPSLQ